MSESGTFIQEAVQTQTKFPEVGSAAVVKKFHKNFELRLSSRKPKAQKAPKPSLLETRRERRGDDDKPEGGLGFGAADYVPQEHKLITQFNGVETDSGSCLAFAPSVRGGPGNTVEPRDWQTPGRQSDNVPSEFVKLEPWAVPCANSWMKDNPSKWQGYSFYTWETPLERCATVVYSLGLQPVLAFVGGLEFDMMPSPIAEVETFVCWPDTQPGGPQLSSGAEMHIMSGGVPLLTRTIRLKKRFGSGTGFSNGHLAAQWCPRLKRGNIGATTASGKANFGVPEDGADDSGLNAMDRDSLLQANASACHEASESRVREQGAKLTEEEHFIASMLYDDEMGTNVTESFHGAEAARRMKPLFPKAESLVEAQGQATDEHVLFSFRSPSNGLVGFEIQGLLSDNKLQLSVQMQFGPITTPRKRMTIMDLAQQLQIILTAIPFISVSSKATAVQAMSNFDTLAESHMPTSTDQGIGAFTNYWIISGENHRSGQRGKMIYWDNGPKSDPFNSAPTSGWRLVSDGNGQFWLVTGYAASQAGKMVYVKNGAFHSYNFNEDAKCKWKLEEDGGEYWLVTGPEHHTPGQMLYLTGSGWSLWNFGRDQKCKFRVVEVEFKIQPFMLSPAEVWIVTAPDHREEENMDNRMIFWKAGGPDNYALNYDPACRWILKPNGNGEYWLVTGSGSDSPGKMVYLKSDAFSVWNWNEDPKCMSAFLGRTVPRNLSHVEFLCERSIPTNF
ncbi:FCPA [Symbiodinium natans]|uniref:FCPA protein n=1 Tax=Symbiodinium natans TaxID=878477 RepID=A0A812PNJ9_9DINO|nr:FCPA [Symbiodinium natans]